MQEAEKLDFSYKYPFSKEAIEFIGAAPKRIDEKFLRLGRIRLEEDISKRSAPFSEVKIDGIKKSVIISYVYSRMLASALNDTYLLSLYINAECGRVKDALKSDSNENIAKLAEELGISLQVSEDIFSIRFEQFLMNRPRGLSLAGKSLELGQVYMTAAETADIIAEAARKKISANLPISQKQLPKEVIEYSKGVKKPVRKARATSSRTYEWIERILETPIPDIRHRTVNQILAPYLVNVRNMPEDGAAKIISEYIEKCKSLNPDTKVNSSYINYQCRYAKAKGLRPLSLKRAKELYEGILEFGG